MKLTESNVDKLFSEKNLYRVPLYQRHYVWNKRNWTHLWTDIKRSNLKSTDGKSAKTHFTGAIVIQPDAENLEIIDGQQRLTTFQIILCAIRDVCKAFDNDPINIATTTEDCVLNDPSRLSRSSRSSDQRYKLLPRAGSDQQTFQSIIAAEIAEAEKNDKNGLIYGAYNYFKNEIKRYVAQDYHKLHSVLNTVLKDFVVAQITVDSDDEYAKIFESINGRGQHLDQFDLLRNNLFLRAKTGNERDRLYSKYWYQFEEDVFWRKLGVVDDFLKNFLKIKLIDDFEEPLELFDLYQEYRESLNKSQNIEYEFSELEKYSKLYQALETGSLMEFYKALNDSSLDRLLDVKRLVPFLLFINRTKRCKKELASICHLLESYIIQCALVYGERRNRLVLEEIHIFFSEVKQKTDIFSEGYLAEFLSNIQSAPWPNDKQVKSALRSITNNPVPLKKYIQNKFLEKKDLDDADVSELIKSSNKQEIEDLFPQFCQIWPSREYFAEASAAEKKKVLTTVQKRDNASTVTKKNRRGRRSRRFK